jgi:hypothetical protein
VAGFTKNALKPVEYSINAGPMRARFAAAEVEGALGHAFKQTAKSGLNHFRFEINVIHRSLQTIEGGDIRQESLATSIPAFQN